MKKTKLILFVAFAWLPTFFCRMSLSQGLFQPGFSIHLLPGDVTAEKLAALDLKNLKPRGDPILSMADIVAYQKETHEMEVYDHAAERLRKLHVPVGGRLFAVFVGDEPIYTGAFWTGFSSLSFDGVVINVTEMKGRPAVAALTFGYPKPSTAAVDPRPDPRVFAALEKAGVLYESIEIVGRCQRVILTRKRYPSAILTFSVDSVIQGNFSASEVAFEWPSGGPGRALFDAVMKKGGRDIPDPRKRLLLKFLRQVGGINPKMRLKAFDVQKN